MNQNYEAIIANFKKNVDQYRRLVKNWRTHTPRNLDKDLAEAQSEAFREIDCLSCGNCCRALGPRLKPRDIPVIAKSLSMPVPKFEERYLRTDEDGDTVFNTRPCPFLGADNACFIYEDRPWACKDYPHLDGRNQLGRLDLILTDAEVCPAVAKALERFLPGDDFRERSRRKDQ